MPIYLELLVMLLLTYAVGLGIGWALWGAGEATPPDNKGEND